MKQPLAVFALTLLAALILPRTAIAGESMTAQMLIGAAIIVVSVMLVTANNKKKPKHEEIKIHESITPCERVAA